MILLLFCGIVLWLLWDDDGDDDNSIMEAKDGDSTDADGVVMAGVNDVRAC